MTDPSDNPEDVATVLRVKQGTGLHICIFGDVKDCRVYLTEYKGDGTSLTMDDIVPVPDKKTKNTEVQEDTELPENTEQPEQEP